MNDATPSTDPPAALASESDSSRRISRIGQSVLLAAGLAGGVLGWMAMEGLTLPFTISADDQALYDRSLGGGGSPEEIQRLLRIEQTQARRNAAFSMGCVGLPVVCLTGLAAGGLVRSAGAGLAAACAGAALGGVSGAVGGWTGTFVRNQFIISLRLDETLATIAAHGIAWTFIAAAAALTVRFAFRREPVSLARLLGAAVGGAWVAALLYPFVAALAFQLSNSDQAIPGGFWNRLVWIELAIGLTMLGIGRSLARHVPSELPVPNCRLRTD